MIEHGVRLERMPEAFEVPAWAQNRLTYDASGRRLVFRGFMSKSDFDKLNLLSDDWPYRRALEELFREATPERDEGGDDRPAHGLWHRLSHILHGARH
jgi:hypothetical protein